MKNFFRNIGNALARFMYGRHGIDKLSLTALWTAIILDLLGAFTKTPLVGATLSILSTALSIWAIFRCLSKNLARRSAEERLFQEKISWPVRRFFRDLKTRIKDREHKYFTCPTCHTMCRVPRGKGKLIITCPRCGRQIRGKS